MTTPVDLSFAADPGQLVALVGATRRQITAMALLYRVYDPQSGTIRIDGRDIRDVKLASLRRNIGVIFQEPLLFNRSVAENLRVGNPDATEADIRELKAADVIERHEGGQTPTSASAAGRSWRRASAALDRPRAT